MTAADDAYRAAEAAIAEAKRDGARELDFFSKDEFKALETLPPEIGELSDLTRLDLFGTQVAGMAPLAGLSALQWLDLRSTKVVDITPLTGLSALETLSLDSERIADITPLAGLSALQELYLSDTQVADIAPLAGLFALKTLYLTNTQVADIAPLAGLSALQALYLSDTQVADIASLAGLSALQTLDLNSTQVADIAPLAGLSVLQSLYLKSTPVADIAPLAGLSALQTLDLDGTQVADLRPVAAADGLLEGSKELGGGLHFSDIPATRIDPDGLGRLSRIEGNEKRTRETLAYLRALTDWPPGALAGKEATPPEPRKAGPTFEVNEGGAISLHDLSLGAGDAEQEALKAELLDHLAGLLAGLEGSNQFIRLRDRAARYQGLLDQPTGGIGARAAWALANAMRTALEAHEVAMREGRDMETLPAAAAGDLTSAVEIGGLWLMGHPGVAEAERAAREYRRGPETPGEVAAVDDLVADLSDELAPETRAWFDDLLQSARSAVDAGAQATKVALDAGWNLVSFITRKVWFAASKTATGIAFVGGVGGGAAFLGNLILKHEVAIRAYMSVEMPQALPALDKLVDAIRAAAQFF